MRDFQTAVHARRGLEPPAYCLEGSCSILLSYWRIPHNRLRFIKKLGPVERAMGIEPTDPA